eukprot:1865494-Prymnesium_polylepis.1
MVDCDGQQNLMQMAWRHAVDNNAVAPGDYGAYAQSLMPAGSTVKSLEEATRRYRKDNGQGNSDLCFPYAFPVADGPGPANNKRLFIVLAGDDFEEVDKIMGEKHEAYLNTGGTAPGSRQIPGMLWHAIWRAGKSVQGDYILLDLAPAVNSTNKSLLMHSDYFITPCLAE